MLLGWIALCTLLHLLGALPVRYRTAACDTTSSRLILDYDVTSVTRNETSADTRAWSTYIDGVCRRGRVLSADELQSPTRFVPLNTASTFFVQDVSWYASRYGFVSPSAFSMCPFFCRDTKINTLYGYYNFATIADKNTSSVYQKHTDHGTQRINHTDHDNNNNNDRRIKSNRTSRTSYGGNWPMAGLYVAELQSDKEAGSRVCVEVNESSTTVEFHRLTLHHDYRARGYLTAQVTVHHNGTIVMRYLHLPHLYDSPAPLTERIKQDANNHNNEKDNHDAGATRAANTWVPQSMLRWPSTGLIFSAQLRRVVSTPTRENGIVGYLFVPVRDSCGEAVNRTSCLSLRSACAWCRATTSCVHRTVVAEVCPTMQYTVTEKEEESTSTSAASFGAAAAATAVGNETASSVRSLRPTQSFYRVQMRANATFDTPPSSAIVWRDLAASSGPTIDIPLAFAFPYSNVTSSALSLLSYKALLSAQSNRARLLLLQGSSIFSMQDDRQHTSCNPLWNTCPNGNITNALVPFQIAGQWTRDSTLTMWQGSCVSHMKGADGPRTSKETHHTHPAAVTASATANTCESLVIQIDAICPYSFSDTVAHPDQTQSSFAHTKAAASATRVRYAYQIYLDSLGVVDVVIQQSSSFHSHGSSAASLPATGREWIYSYPPPLVGMFRYGAQDGSTVRVPPALLHSGLGIRFYPVSRCVDCGRHGYCNESLTYTNEAQRTSNTSRDSSKEVVSTSAGVCVCDTGFAGRNCGSCAPQHFGPDCQPCRRCLNGGVCEAGTMGNGACRCPYPFGGIDCGLHCDVVAAAADNTVAPINNNNSSSNHNTRKNNTSAPTSVWRRGVFDFTTPLPMWHGCWSCSTKGGYCDCGVCRCLPGWTGKSCDTIVADNCRVMSLEGCPVCTRTPGCSYCFDDVCFDPNMSGRPGGYSCSYAVEGVDALTNMSDARCHDAERVWGSAVTPMITMVFLFVLVFFVGISYFLITAKRLLGSPVVDEHALLAEGGIVNYKSPRQAREVLHMRTVPSTAVTSGDYLMAIPLKQISLKKLYERQQARRRQGES